ncbi:MAG TPA: hypothetical protein VER03_11360 [Bryobacteraceae bacterium]|nr:hypothetical protein [Bryobacteraceae bacterium]
MVATKYLQDYAQQKKSIGDDAIQLNMLDPMIGDLDLRQVHMGQLQPSSSRSELRCEVSAQFDTCLFVIPRCAPDN